MINTNPAVMPIRLAEEIVPAMRYQGDIPFEEWQKKARKKLKELLGLPYMIPCAAEFEKEETVDCGDYTRTRFSFMSEPGYYVPGYILMPKQYHGKLPLMICVQGHSTGMHISLGITKFPVDEDGLMYIRNRNYAEHAVRRGYCTVVIEQRYMGECGGDAEGPGCCANGREGTESAMKTLLLGRTAIGERVWDISRTIDVLIENVPEINTLDISCMGSSGGGTATFYAACMDTRIAYAMPACAVCTYLESIIKKYHCPCNYIPSIARYFDMGDLGGLIAPRGLVVVAGVKDPIFPIGGVEKAMKQIGALYHSCGADEKAVLVVGDEGHRFYANQAFSAMEALRK